MSTTLITPQVYQEIAPMNLLTLARSNREDALFQEVVAKAPNESLRTLTKATFQAKAVNMEFSGEAYAVAVREIGSWLPAPEARHLMEDVREFGNELLDGARSLLNGLQGLNPFAACCGVDVVHQKTD